MIENAKNEVIDEVRSLLEQDVTALGQVYIAWQKIGENETLIRVSEQAEIPYGTVAAKSQIIKQLLQSGALPSTSTQCITIANDIRRFKSRSSVDISESASLRIDGIVEDLLAKSEDSELVAKEKTKNIQKDEAFSQKAGIYVYTYPHYRKHPAIKASADNPAVRYHLKVGKTIRNTKIRVKEQTAGMPESPIPLLMIVGKSGVDFSIENALIDNLERQIHEHLEVVGHARYGENGGGKEWFLSNKETIVSIADLLGLEFEDPDDQVPTDD